MTSPRVRILIASHCTNCSTISSFPPLSNSVELYSILQSAFLKMELDLLLANFYDILTRLGFKNDIMNLEGRVDYSALEYHTGKLGVIDLIPRAITRSSKTVAEDQPPVLWLIEINTRPPIMKGTQIIKSTYGIDYWGLDILIVLAYNKTRVRSLSQPFKHGPQYSSVMVFIPADYPAECEESSTRTIFVPSSSHGGRIWREM